MNEMKWMNEWHEWMNEMNEWMHEWMNGWMAWIKWMKLMFGMKRHEMTWHEIACSELNEWKHEWNEQTTWNII